MSDKSGMINFLSLSLSLYIYMPCWLFGLVGWRCDKTLSQVAMLNLKAGQKAMLARSYSDAAKYLKVALALRDSIGGRGPWEGEEERRRTTMKIYLEAISAHYWNFEVPGDASTRYIIGFLKPKLSHPFLCCDECWV